MIKVGNERIEITIIKGRTIEQYKRELEQRCEEWEKHPEKRPDDRIPSTGLNDPVVVHKIWHEDL